MLTWDEASSSRPAGLSANKVMIADRIVRNSMMAQVDDHKVVETMKSMYESFLARCTLEHIDTAVQCAYTAQPIARNNKTKKAVRFIQRPRHFFSAQKLNMRNAP